MLHQTVAMFVLGFKALSHCLETQGEKHYERGSSPPCSKKGKGSSYPLLKISQHSLNVHNAGPNGGLLLLFWDTLLQTLFGAHTLWCFVLLNLLVLTVYVFPLIFSFLGEDKNLMGGNIRGHLAKINLGYLVSFMHSSQC